MEDITQRSVTGNHSTADISHKHVFLFDNKFSKTTITNNTGGNFILKEGLVVIRDIANPTKVIPAIAGATLENIVGVISSNDKSELSVGTDLDTNYCHGGTVNKNLLVLPSGVTFDTLITGTGMTVGDKLKSIGFELEGSIDNTKFDN